MALRKGCHCEAELVVCRNAPIPGMRGSRGGMGKKCTIMAWPCDCCLRGGVRMFLSRLRRISSTFPASSGRLVVVREEEREVDGGGGEGRVGGW